MIDKFDVGRHFMTRHVVGNVGLNILFGDAAAGTFDDESVSFFAVLFGGNADDLYVDDVRMSIDEVFDLFREDIFTATNYHILDPAGDAVVAARIADSQVAGVQPTVLIDSGGGSFGHLIITLHDVVAADNEFAGRAVGQVFACIGVDDLGFHERHLFADGVDPDLQRIVYGSHRAGGRSFGLSVGNGDLGHVHLVYDVAHDFNRAGRTRHDARAEAGEIVPAEVAVFQDPDKHCGNAVNGGALFVFDRVHDLHRSVPQQRYHSRTVSDCRHDSQYHAEAVEERHRYAQLVLRGELHAVADGFAVVDYVVVGQHNAFRETGGAGSVLHVDYVVGVDGMFDGVELFVADQYAEVGDLRPVVHSVVPVIQRNDVS